MDRITFPAIEAKAAEGTPKRFEVTAYTGGALRLSNYDLPVVVDLAGLKPRKNLVANLDHDQQKRVGHIDHVDNDGRELRLSGAISAKTPHADEVIASGASGFPWSASIEVNPLEMETVPKGRTVMVNGQTFAGPILITRRGVLHGFAFVSHGADANTVVSLAANFKGKKMFSAWLSQMGFNAADLTENQLAAMHANYDGRQEITPEDRAAVAPLICASSDPVEAEQRRLRQIKQAVRGDWGDHAGRVEELQAQATSGALTIDELLGELRTIRAGMLEASIPSAHTVTRSRRTAADDNVLTAALCLTGNLPNIEAHFDERTLDAASKMRGFGLQQLLLQAASANGYSCGPGEHITHGNIRTVLQHAFPPIHAGVGSYASISNILSNTANKQLRTGWNSVDQCALRISGRASAKNFHSFKTISLVGDVEFEKLGAAGEIKHGTLGEVVYTNKVDTYAKMLAITRQDIINDDMSALSAAPQKLGRGAMLKLNDIFWTAFLRGETDGFFSATHTNPTGASNLNTGAADVTTGGLTETERMFLAQIDPDGKPLGIMPAIMLVPPTLKRTAMALLNSQLLINGTSTAAQPSGNIWQSAFRLETSPYMENTAYTGYSPSAWYLMADPSQLPTIVIAALNGRLEPTIDTADADFNVLGVQMRGYSDVGVALQEYRACVKADGGSS